MFQQEGLPDDYDGLVDVARAAAQHLDYDDPVAVIGAAEQKLDYGQADAAHRILRAFVERRLRTEARP